MKVFIVAMFIAAILAIASVGFSAIEKQFVQPSAIQFELNP